MAKDRDRSRGRRGRRGRPAGRRPRDPRRVADDDRGGYDADDFDSDDYEPDDDVEFDDFEPDEDERPARRASPAKRRGSSASRRRPSRGGKRDSGRSRQGAGDRIDFGAVDFEDDSVEIRAEPRRGSRPRAGREGPEPASRRRRPRRRRKRERLSNLCVPVFGYAATLPREDGAPQPDYLSFRQGVVSAMQRIDSEAKENEIDPQDAREAKYALAAYMDEQVAGSQWSSRDQWLQEPLNIVMSQDPDAGGNFFNHIRELRDDQIEVKKVYLYCLALGFKGRLAVEEPRVQTQKIGAIKKQLLDDVQERGMEDEEFLFPEAYDASQPLEDEVEPVPAWWKWASLGTVAAVLLLWVVLYFVAGASPGDAEQAMSTLLGEGS